MTERPVSK